MNDPSFPAHLSASASASEVMTFDRFEAGQPLGAFELTVDDTMLALWEKLYGNRPGDADRLPAAFAPLILMRALLSVVAPRPPGNLHVGQTCDIRAMPRAHQPFVAAVECRAKTLRKERRVVDFLVSVRSTDDGTPLLSGTSTIFWAR